MPTMTDALRGRTALGEADVAWLHLLVAEWQLLADLSFADLLLWVPLRHTDRLLAVAQMRPLTGPTAHQHDLVGRVVTAGERPQLWAALREGRFGRESDPVWVDGVPVREEAIPVRHHGRVVAVVSRETNLASSRTPSRLEITYLQTADDLARMVSEGRFPFPGDRSSDEAGPRVGDGMIRLAAEGTVEFASPNAQSAFRRLGWQTDLVGQQLVAATRALTNRSDEEVGAVASGAHAGTVEVETAGAVVVLRAIPLCPDGDRIGAAVLVHDITELRRRDRQLVGKDATIREIHHRVKNNLQTVAALLRLQARRLDVPEARAALEESVRRVSSIALVHETLSLTLEEAVAFDAIADRVTAMVTEVAADDRPVTWRRTGSFGELPAAVSTPLAMVLTELVQNAVEHGRASCVEVEVRVHPGRLTVAVRDDGTGLPAGFRLEESNRLGLQIVRTLVEHELAGRLALANRSEGGTEVVLDLPRPAAG